MASILDILKKSLPSVFDVKDATKKSMDWFKSLVRRATGQRRFKPLVQISDLDDPIRKTNRILPGQMYHFVYDPKWKKILPYYDKFPLIFPVSFYNDGYLGINFHYLRPEHRAVLLDALLANVSNKRYDETTKMKISYAILQSAASHKYYKPCIKRYLYSHVKSPYIQIDPNEWATSIYLNTAKFEKKSQSFVWNISVAKSNKKVKK